MWKTCSRGHKFQESSDGPVCPVCWPARENKIQSDFPKVAAPALRALHAAKIKTLKQLSKKTEAEVLSLHGMGQNAIQILKQALRKSGLSFQKEKEAVKYDK